MYKWRLLLLASLAVFQPIASFTERNLVDGRQECCDRQPHSFQRDTRLAVYGTSRRNNLVTDQRRANYRSEVPKSTRYIENNVDINIESRQQIRDRDNRRITSLLNDRFSSERRYIRETIPGKHVERTLDERLTRNTHENDRDNRIIAKTNRVYDNEIQSRFVSRRTRDSSDRSQSIKETEIRNKFHQTRREIVRTDSANTRNEPRISRDNLERRNILSQFEMRRINNNIMERRSLERKTRDADETNRRSSSQSRLFDWNSNRESRGDNLNIRTERRFVRNRIDHERLESRILNNGDMDSRLLNRQTRSLKDRESTRISQTYNTRKDIREIREKREVERDEGRYSNRRVRQSRDIMSDTEFRQSRHSDRRNIIPSSSKTLLLEVREMKLDDESRSNINRDRRFLYQQERVNTRHTANRNDLRRDYAMPIINENRNYGHNNQRDREINTMRRITRSLDRHFRQNNERRERSLAVRDVKLNNNDVRESRNEVENEVRFRIINQNLRYSEKQMRESNKRVQSRRNTNERRILNVNDEQINVEGHFDQSRIISRQTERKDNSYRERHSNNNDENIRLSTLNNRSRGVTEPLANSRNKARYERRSLNRVRNVNQLEERPQREVERRVTRERSSVTYEARDQSTRMVDARDNYARIQKNTPRILSGMSKGENVRDREMEINDMSRLNSKPVLRRVEERSRNIDSVNREFTMESRLFESAKYREDLMPLVRNKSEPDYQAPVLSWQYLFYTLQGIYLCTIIMQMLSDNKSGAKKISLWNSTLKATVKVD